MKILNYHFLSEKNLRLRIDNQTRKLERDLELKEDVVREQALYIKSLRKKVDEEKLQGLIKVDIGDPTPEKGDQRREYIARVAGFYKDIFQSKCLQMISAFHKLLEDETNDSKTDSILKIGVYVCREFMVWGEKAISEQIANQVDKPLSAEEQKEETITQIKL